MNAKPLILVLSFLAILVTPAYATVIHVSPSATGDGSGASWENSFTTITAGFLASASGDEIWVKSATYYEAIRLRTGVGLYGGFAGSESERDQRDWASRPTVINATGLGKSVVIGANHAVMDGFTITGGSARLGGGVDFMTASMTLQNCRIIRNRALWGAGVYLGRKPAVGVYDISAYPSAVLINCIMSENLAEGNGGGGYGEYVQLYAKQCLVANNVANISGGGLLLQDVCGSVMDCKISSNRTNGVGGGVDLRTMGYVYNQCRSSQGETPADCGKLSPMFTNCLITGNHAGTEGGGIYCDQVTPTFTNCTIAGNAGGGLYSRLGTYYDDWVGNDDPEDFLECGCEGVPSLINCVVWNDDPITLLWADGKASAELEEPVLYDPGPEGLNVTASCILDGWYGQALDVDPLFVDPEHSDYRLQSGSPCIDSGTNDPVLNISLDLDGNLRIWNGQGDMGAYEFQPPPPPQLWLLDGFGEVHVLPVPTPTP